jgi:hypothetical protein
MLWVRALDSLEARPLAGTDSAAWPFWSPDSLSIGFFAPHKLKAVEIGGGPAREIADVIVGRGAAWSREGVIVFGPRPVGPLHRVSDAGGQPVPVTSLDETRGEVMHAFPQFMPDGRQFLHLAASSQPGGSSVRAGSLDSASSKMLLSSDTSAAYAPVLPGYPPSLLFVHNGSLMAQAFDPRSLELSGERTVIVPEVRYQRWNQPQFSVSGDGVLLYQSGCAENHQLTWFNRQGEPFSAAGPRNNFLSFALSPDERYVAVNRLEDPGTALPTIWVVDLSRGSAVFRFTDPDVGEPEFNAVWAPNGSEILFSRGDERRMRLFRQALSGGAARCVLDTVGPKFLTDWSSDGQFLCYSSQVPDYRNLHIWILALTGEAEESKPRSFLQHPYQEFGAQFSPANGAEGPRWLAYASDETGRYEIYVRDFPDGRHKWQASSQGGLQPHWCGDGRELFYLTPDGTVMSVPVNPGSGFEFGPSEQLFPTGFRFQGRYSFWMNQFDVARDGQRFLLNRRLPEPAQGAITAAIPR